MLCAVLCTEVVQFSGLGFVTLGPVYCVDLFLFMCLYSVFLYILHICCIIVTRWTWSLPVSVSSIGIDGLEYRGIGYRQHW